MGRPTGCRMRASASITLRPADTHTHARETTPYGPGGSGPWPGSQNRGGPILTPRKADFRSNDPRPRHSAPRGLHRPAAILRPRLTTRGSTRSSVLAISDRTRRSILLPDRRSDQPCCDLLLAEAWVPTPPRRTRPLGSPVAGCGCDLLGGRRRNFGSGRRLNGRSGKSQIKGQSGSNWGKAAGLSPPASGPIYIGDADTVSTH